LYYHQTKKIFSPNRISYRILFFRRTQDFALMSLPRGFWGGAALLLLLASCQFADAQDDSSEESCSSLDLGSYNLGFAIASVFVILIVSFVGFMTPILLSSSRTPYLQLVIVACAAGGTGVIITVAFVHILGDASEFLSSPCLPQGFLDAYPGWAMLFCTISIVLIILVDYFLRYYLENKTRKAMVEISEGDNEGEKNDSTGDNGSKEEPGHVGAVSRGRNNQAARASRILVSFPTSSEILMETAVSGHATVTRYESGRLLSSSTTRGLQVGSRTQRSSKSRDSFRNEVANTNDTKTTLSQYTIEEGVPDSISEQPQAGIFDDGHGHPPGSEIDDMRLKRGIILFVEFSVMTHSVPVGLALGLQTGGAFTGLFVAVLFHQLLEGFGIGAATVEGKYSRAMEILLALGFSITAPIGIAIGIILHESLNQNSSGYLLTVGIVNSIAAGLLIYVGLEHLNAMSSRGAWMRMQSWLWQGIILSAFVLGAVALMVVGKYA